MNLRIVWSMRAEDQLEKHVENLQARRTSAMRR